MSEGGGASDGAAYRPIDCSLHDRLEDLAVCRRVVRIRYRDGGGRGEGSGEGVAAELDDVIVAWFTRGGAEYLRTAGGREIRLDRILEVDGQPYG